ncbi:hypothetical protein FVG97_21055 [Salmonella enterica]|uniref:hypothetical protein n=1 Tax=Salmonella enterica TaxID=28901 RepID=UPI000A385FAB|nr:hypothetical protein [Salmonella enterica]ECF2429025.1 hypothetical protein [Salmonella enterica subsp. enterica serovar Beaudesert]EDS4241226.1 hypothetical protein [Salmonella enterica subsp. enterica]HCT1198183.1 hypothetical protein [Salmonella enterica subsp. enterica serovar Bovismorbificans]HEC6393194.1 hypothetical protein [Salmonella enterica subsp. enterica serovar Warragul]EAA7137275.1 hypothetical protein [Salmonella enterica]
MLDNRTSSAIDLAFERKPMPVYVVSRHGYVKRCLSRDTAIHNLAKFMTRKVFQKAGRPVEYAPVREIRPEGEVWVTQGPTWEFRKALHRCVRRLRHILARKREIQKWNEKYDAWAVRWDEMMKQRPY